jgi:hypothetical protein
MTLQPQGICLQAQAQIVFPDGTIEEGSVWQHTDGARCIYAAVTQIDGGELYYALEPQWHIQDHHGQPVYQGMSPTD